MPMTPDQPSPASQRDAMTVDVGFNPRPPVLAGAPLDDATALAWLNSLVPRLLICVGTLALALVVVAVPIPYILGPAVSVTQKVMDLYAIPTMSHLQYLRPGEGFATYFRVALASAFILDHPVLAYQLLAILAPPGRCPSRSSRLRVVHACTAAFGLGILAGIALIRPMIAWLISLPIGVDVVVGFAEYFQLVVTLVIGVALAFELPVLMVGLIWLGIVSRQRLASWRKYAVLLAFTVAALVTPTPDALNQTIVAGSVYLMYEIGLRLAHLIRADFTGNP
jgi:sec-independent protein translocase protein TatC